MEINNKSIIHDSFLRLINSSNLIKKDFFCNDDCYYKCLNVIEKIKNGTIDTSKIDWNSNQNNWNVEIQCKQRKKKSKSMKTRNGFSAVGELRSSWLSSAG